MPGKSLHFRLAKDAAFLALLLGLVISGIQVFIDFNSERDRIKKHITEIINSGKSSAVEAAFHLDRVYAQSIADGMVQYESIANVSIYDDRKNVLAFAGFPTDMVEHSVISDSIISGHDFSMMPLYRYPAKDAVGAVSVEVNAHKLTRDFINRATTVFVSGFVRSMAMMLVFLVLFYLVLTRPLLKTIRELSAIDQDDQPNEVTFGASLARRDDELGSLVNMFHDLLDNRKQAQDRLKRMAFYDLLTSLPNRLLLMDRLQQNIKQARRYQQLGAVFFLDLDNFKNINDALGHLVGDQLIQQTGNRLVSALREEDTVGRLGGDEFLIIIPNLGGDTSEAMASSEELANKIRQCFSQPYMLDNHELFVKPSIGITLYPDPYDDPHELLKQADTAMYQAKANGGDSYCFYVPEMQDKINRRLILEQELRDALIQQQLQLHYQPQINERGELYGIEALVRWNHPERGMVAPNEFIYIAEDSGLIAPLGNWVLRKACEDYCDLRGSSLPQGCRLSVNISVRQFYYEDFVADVLHILQTVGMSPNLLTLEVTESIMIGRIDETLHKMTELRQHGIEFSIDDFGTGYSSLQYLKGLPFSELKIDRSFIITIEDDEVTLVATMLSMGRSLNLRVVSEGVETPEQANILYQKGCRIFQGFYFSKPLSYPQLKQFKWPTIALESV